MTDLKKINIQIFSDVICPWCFIGKKRLDNVILALENLDVAIRWRPYQLYPGLPPEGMDRQEYLQRKYGSVSNGSAGSQRIKDEARSVGIDIRYDLIQKIPNTSYAHSMLELAVNYDLQHELSEGLFEAYFCQGLDVGDLNVLVDVGVKAGIPAAETQNFFDSFQDVMDLERHLDLAHENNIFSVPGYLFDNGYLLPGAQAEETISQVLTRVSEKV